ncbi:MAG: hypothetical protein K2H49_01840, partial [Muribaculaceae bacterium]|nr:hypothetical protein [Muribaculaceae bacterium]
MSKKYILLTLLILCLASCDEGRIYNDYSIHTEEGGSADFSGEVTGTGTWSAGYTLALAGFGEGDDYAVISKNIETEVTDEKCEVTLSGIPSNVTTIELCALDRLRRRVATFLCRDYNSHNGRLHMDADRLDLSMANAIQTEIFNTTCIQCHGGTEHPAAGLDLLPGKSFGNLISVSSRKMPGIDRVAPGKSSESELLMILAADSSAG